MLFDSPVPSKELAFNEPMPLDHAARLAKMQDVSDTMMEQSGTDIIEQLLALPKGFDVVEAQHDRLYRADPGHRKWSETAKICTDFYEGKQWTQEEINQLKDEGRPINTKNKISPMMRLLLGYFRQNRYDIRFMPAADGEGTDDTADLLNAQSKQIDEANGTKWVDASVFQDGLFTGRGFWDSRLDFSKNRLGDIKESILDPFSVVIDNEASSYDPNGTGGEGAWSHWIYNRWMTVSEIFLLYGKMPVAELNNNLPSMPIVSDYYYGFRKFDVSPDRWFGLESYLFQDFERSLARGGNILDHLNRNRKLVRVIDCQHKQLKKVNFFIDLVTGQEKIIPEDMPLDKIQRIMQWAQARQLPLQVSTDYKQVIRWTVTAGDRVLHDAWSPYENYTCIPYFPYFRRGKTMSPIEDLLDPQREINKRSAAFLHIIMSTANSGWMWEKGALDAQMEREVEDEGARPGIHIKYEEGYDAPKRIEPAATPMNMKKLEDDANRDIKEIAGINDSALGQLDRVQSGVAVQARQKQAIIGAEPYFDNFAHSQELKGRQRLSLIQGFYTEPRLLRIRKGDGSSEIKAINQKNAAGEVENNITVGNYDLAIDEAPASATFQQAQFEDAMQLVEKGVPIPPDILVELSSCPRKSEIKDRMNEERMIQLSSARFQNLMQHAQAGTPPSAPFPPIVTDGGPPIMDLSKTGGAAAAPGAPAAPPPGGAAPPGMPPGPGGQPPGTVPAGRPRPIMGPDGRLIQPGMPPMGAPPM